MKIERRGERRIDRMKGLHKKKKNGKYFEKKRRKGEREKAYAKKIKRTIEYYYSVVMNYV